MQGWRMKALVLRAFLLAVLLALAPASVSAAVKISFYSHEFGSSFPHAFITLEGEDARTGQTIKADYGFTATHVTPAILLGSVRGEVMSLDPVKDADYLPSSDLHFAFDLTDAEYEAVMATVERWRSLKQPSYNLNRQNCVFFIAHLAAAVGMKADTPRALMKKPRSYLQSVTKANRSWLEARGSTFAGR